MDVKKQITAAFEAELKKKDGDKIRVIYLPIYMSYLLKEPETEQLIVDLYM